MIHDWITHIYDPTYVLATPEKNYQNICTNQKKIYCIKIAISLDLIKMF